MPTPDEIAQNFDWDTHRKFLKRERFRPMYDRAFNQALREKMGHCFGPSDSIKTTFFEKFDGWIHGSKLNSVRGLEAFPNRDFILGVTHSIDDLHIAFGLKLVAMEGEYPYHTRMRPDFVYRKLETLRSGDVLVFSIPFCRYGAEHPQTREILQRCQELKIPVHADAAWYGCLRDFHFDFNHPAIETVSFSLSKSLGLGSHRVGVRYSRTRHTGPVTIINNFAMEISSVMHAAVTMIDQFGPDYLQNRYGRAYTLTCEHLGLLPTNALHVALEKDEGQLVGIRPFLRFLVDEHNEFH